MFVDTHCHVYAESCENIENTINEAVKNKVTKLIDCAEDLKSTKEILELSKIYKGIIYPTIGIHPEYAETTTEEELKEVENLIKNNTFLAMGEIGLDYYYSKKYKIKQQNLFRKQLQLAEKYNLPVVVHSREATLDTINILKEYKVKGVIHSFSGSEETAKQYIKMGFLLGINGVITFKNSKLKEEIKNLSIDNFVLETDSPYLSPVPYRGEINSPKNIPLIAKFLAEVMNVPLEEVMKKTTINATHVFDNFC